MEDTVGIRVRKWRRKFCCKKIVSFKMGCARDHGVLIKD